MVDAQKKRDIIARSSIDSHRQFGSPMNEDVRSHHNAVY